MNGPIARQVKLAREDIAQIKASGNGWQGRMEWWIGRLQARLELLCDAIEAGQCRNGGERLRTVLDALADGAAYRRGEAARWCSDCEAAPTGACEDHLGDLSTADGYERLLRQLRQEAVQ